MGSKNFDRIFVQHFSQIKFAIIASIELVAIISTSCYSKDKFQFRGVFFNNNTFKIADVDSSFNMMQVNPPEESNFLVNILYYKDNEILFYSKLDGVNYLNKIIYKYKNHEMIIYTKTTERLNCVVFSKVIDNMLYYTYSSELSKINRYDLKENQQVEPLFADVGELLNLWKSNSLLNPEDYVFTARKEKSIKSGFLNINGVKSQIKYFDFVVSDYYSKNGSFLGYDRNEKLFFCKSIDSEKNIINIISPNGYHFYSAYFVDSKMALICLRKTTSDIVGNFLFSVTDKYKIYHYKYYALTMCNNNSQDLSRVNFFSDDYELVGVYSNPVVTIN